MSKLILCPNTVELRQIAFGAEAFSVVPSWPRIATQRDIASTFFTPMAMALTKDDLTVVMHRHWRDADVPLDEPRKRLLDRTALTVGMVRAGTPDALRGILLGRAGSAAAVSHQPPSLRAGAYLGGVPGTGTLPASVGAQPGLLGPGAGCWQAGRSVLLVCDRPNKSKAGTLKHRLPFLSMVDGGVSLWLAQHLADANIPEEALYWINAYDADDHRTDSSFLKDLKPMAVIAIGQYGKKWCYESDLILNRSFYEVPHPQFYHRQNSSRSYSLGRVIASVISCEGLMRV